ncbi:MAG: hypothetical protein ACE5J5_03525 [Candidatus Hydrothermarchaeales archaeon]
MEKTLKKSEAVPVKDTRPLLRPLLCQPLSFYSLESIYLIKKYLVVRYLGGRMYEDGVTEDQEVDWSVSFDALKDGIVMVDTEYNILRANKAFVRKELKMVEAKREIKEVARYS